MPTVTQIAASPQIAEHMTALGSAGDHREVNGVSLIENVADLREQRPGRFVLLTAHASESVTTYHLDIMVRRAIEADVAAVGLVRSLDPPDFPITASALAHRGQLSVFAVEPGADIGLLLTHAQDVLQDGAHHAIETSARALAAVESHVPADDPAQELAQLVGREFGVDVVLGPPAGPGVPVVVHGRPEATFVVPSQPMSAVDTLMTLVLHRAAGSAGQAIAAARRAVEIPVASRASLLSELISSAPEEAGPLRGRARRSGIPLEAWHTVLHLEFQNLADIALGDEIAQYDLVAEAGRLAIQTALADGDGWHRADSGSSLTFVRVDRTAPPATVSTAVAATAGKIIGRLKQQFPRVQFYCGIGGSYQGLEGLQTSANESRAGASAARSARRVDRPVVFSTLGFRRSLLQWYSMGSTRLMVDRLFAPLDELDERRRSEALQTLQAYLEHPASAADAAAALNIHRNTLTNRIRRLFDLLDLDEINGDHRLLLQLGCRLRTLA